MFGSVAGWFIALSTLGKAGVVTAASVIPLGLVATSTDSTYSITEKTSIPYTTNYTDDETKNVGENEIISKGEDGEIETEYKVHKIAGVEVSRDKVSSKNTKEPKPATVKKGVILKKQIKESEPVSFSNQNVNDPTMTAGQTKITKAGVNGTKEKTYEVITINGTQKSKTLIGEVVITPPTNQVTAIGTKSHPNCDPNYSPCIPYYAGDALNCADVGMRVSVTGTDHYRLDADNDGTGCDSY